MSNLLLVKENRKISYTRLGLLFGLVSGLLWGLNGTLLGTNIIHKPFINNDLPIYVAPLIVACLHDGFAGVWLLIFNIATGKQREILKSLAIKPGFIVCGAAIIGGPIAMSGYLMGIHYAGATYAMAISAIYPAVGAILSRFILKEKISSRIWLGIVACIIGTFIIGYAPAFDARKPHFYLGILLSFVSAIGWALEGIISTKAMNLLDPTIVINIRQLTSFIIYIICIIPLVSGLPLLKISLMTYGGLAFVVIGLIGATSYLCWYKSMSMIGVSRAMALNITYAFWGIIFGTAFTASRLTIQLVMGALIIIVGAILIIINPKKLEYLIGLTSSPP